MDPVSQKEIPCDQLFGGVELSFRSVDCADLDAVEQLAQASGLDWDRQSLAYFLSHQCRVAYGIFLKDTETGKSRLAAYVLALLVQRELDIVSIATHPYCRRCGLAQKLLEYLFFYTRSGKVVLEVSVNNTPAIHLYKKLGFSIRKHRRNYYSDSSSGSRDAYLMSRVQNIG